MSVAPEGTPAFWSQSAEDAFRRLQTGVYGLTGAEAARGLAAGEGGLRKSGAGHTTLRMLWAQFKSPIILILLFAAILSGYPGDVADAVIISAIALVSGLLGFWQERITSGHVRTARRARAKQGADAARRQGSRGARRGDRDG